MIAVPIALVLFGYWVLYAGVKRVSLADAWACKPSAVGQTQTSQAGPGISVQPVTGGPTLRVTTDCTPRAGDTRIPTPRGGYFLWRPIGSGILGQINGQLIGPC